MDQSACYSIDEQLVLYLEFDSVFQRLFRGMEHVVEGFCLSDCAREAIEDEAETCQRSSE